LFDTIGASLRAPLITPSHWRIGDGLADLNPPLEEIPPLFLRHDNRDSKGVSRADSKSRASNTRPVCRQSL
jgi:hypothetical protein